MRTTVYIVLVFSLVLCSCENLLFEAEPINGPEEIFEALWSAYDAEYAPFELRGVDWDDQYQIFKPRVNKNTSDEELFHVFKEMLGTLNDGHVQMTVPNQRIFFSNLYYNTKYEDELFDYELIEDNYFTSEARTLADSGVQMGWIDQIGYVRFGWVGENFLEMNQVLDYFADANGLIIDLRHNTGGDFTYALSEFGRLTSEERYTHRSKTKNGKGKDDFTDWFKWSVYPACGYYDKPLVLLTDRYTISAGERATMAFKTLPNLVHVGDTTNGSHSALIPRELANGWFYTVAPQIIEFKDGISYEGIGLIPDVVVENTLEEMEAGQDKALEAAIAHF